MNLKKLSKIAFLEGSVSVCGKKGRGKDMLFANIIYSQGRPYISNTDYKCKTEKNNCVYIPLDFNLLDCNNTYKNFIDGNIKQYIYPYPQNTDIYISDCGVYFPSQYDSQLDKDFKHLPIFFALSRQLGNDCRIHTNCQNLSRVWKKCREMSDEYINCNWCKVYFKKIVVQKITIYDKFKSCEDNVKPYVPIKIPLLASKEMRASLRMKNEEMKRLFEQSYGSVRSYILIYKNRTNYDTRVFDSILKGGS